MRSSVFSAAVAFAVFELCAAQTFTDCNPTEKTCPSDKALGKTVTVDFTKGGSTQFTALTGTTMTYGTNGAEFTINSETQAPTMESAWYMFFGKVDVVMQAAPGVGIVSSFVLESDDLDEIDWEWLGGDLTEVESNYFGKGNTTTYDRAIYHPVSAPQTTFHTYTIDWTSSYVKWSIDGTLIRTLNYADANGGKNFPQTPMRVKLGNWVGGSSTGSPGTVSWAGGLADFSKAPFTMYVKSVTIADAATGATEYTYGDLTGSYQSIVVAGGSGAEFLASNTTSSSTVAAASSTTVVSSSTRASSVASPSSTVSAVSTSTNVSSTLVTSTTAPTTTATSTKATSNTSTTATRSASATSAIATGAASKYGVADVVVVVLGLGLGFLFM